MAEKKWCVYCHINKINGKKYVGITSYPTTKRWGTKGQGYKTQYFNRAITKYGWDNFEHEVLFYGLEEKIAKEKEIELIARYKTKDKRFGYNLTDGGDGTIGVVLSDNARENMRISHLGQVAWNKGLVGKVKVSEKTILKKIALWKNEEYRERQLKSHTGNKQSEETKKKISENSSRTRSVYQLTLDGVIVNKFDRIINAVKFTGIKSSLISSCCSEYILSTNGFIFVYEKDMSNEYIKKRTKLINDVIEKRNKERLPVYKYNTDGILIEKYNCMEEAINKTSYSKSGITSSCYDAIKSYMGFIWSRSDDYFIINKKVESYNKSLFNGRPKIVYKFNDKMQLIETYSSCSKVIKLINVTQGTLKRHCVNGEPLMGFYWRMEGIE